MKIALLSGASSIHTIRWANGLSNAGHDVHVFTQQTPIDPFVPSVTVHQFPFLGVLGYFYMVPTVRRIFSEIKPDIVNAHYASGYGTTARLVNYLPWVLSVWGSDVYDFPMKSPLHKYLVRKNLLAADKVASTSHCMAEQTRQLAPELLDIAITPFGVEVDNFSVGQRLASPNDGPIVIGTVKAMAPKYGISALIRSFALVRQKLLGNNPTLAHRLELRLVGDGPQTEELKRLVEQLEISNVTTFVGRVPHAQVPFELSKLDIYVALSESESESFGVAIIEAGAASRPVVVSDAGGLPEVTVDGFTGFVSPRNNPQAAAEALLRLVVDDGLRKKMGAAGRAHVAKHYDWQACINRMVSVYEGVLAK